MTGFGGMSEEFTITAAQAVRLTRKLREALLYDMVFAHSLLTASPEVLEGLTAAIKGANALRSNKMDDFQKEIHRGIKLADRILSKSRKLISDGAESQTNTNPSL